MRKSLTLTWRDIVWAVIVIALSVSAPLKSPGVALASSALLLGLGLVCWWARKSPEDPWAAVLLGLALGPRTDVAHMSRSELFQSAASFVTWALFSALLTEIIGLIWFSGSTEPPVGALVVMFFCWFGVGMGVLGAVYLAIRALFRSPNYTPPPSECLEE